MYMTLLAAFDVLLAIQDNQVVRTIAVRLARLTTAASMPPVPEAVSMATVFLVQKTYLRSSSTSASTWRNSADR
jgi:hypothetical protein